MFLKQSNSLFIFLIMISAMLVISSSSWMMAWMGLEINLMSIIPILIKNGSFNSNSTAIKYFLTQVMASMILIFTFMMFYMLNFMNMMNMFNEMVMMSMAMKAGIPPFHFWLPQVLETSSIAEMFIILSWQKIAPFVLFSYVISKMMVFMIMLSAMVGAAGGFNQNSLKKILAFSSMVHASWMISSMTINQETWMLYFMMYTTMLMTFCFMMDKTAVENVSDISSMNYSTKNKILFMTNLLSMGGLPPFSGFFAKVIVLILLIKNSTMYFMMVVMILSSMTSLYYYLKVAYSSFLISSKKMISTKKGTNLPLMVLVVMVLNIILPLLFYLS